MRLVEFTETGRPVQVPRCLNKRHWDRISLPVVGVPHFEVIDHCFPVDRAPRRPSSGGLTPLFDVHPFRALLLAMLDPRLALVPQRTLIRTVQADPFDEKNSDEAATRPGQPELRRRVGASDSQIEAHEAYVDPPHSLEALNKCGDDLSLLLSREIEKIAARLRRRSPDAGRVVDNLVYEGGGKAREDGKLGSERVVTVRRKFRA